MRRPGKPTPAADDSATQPGRPTATRSRFPLRDRPGIAWLAVAGVLALVHPFVPAADWLLVHLVLLGAVTHSAMVWSTHFTQAILRTAELLDDRAQQNRRILVLLAGAAGVLVGVPTGWWALTLAGAVGVTVAAVWHGVALWRRLRSALPGRFRVTVYYYLAAASAVPAGAGLGAWLARGLDDDWHSRVLVAHSMVMVLGWLGLTVTGTLVTLWPTMLRTRMDDRAERLARQSLPVLVAGLVVLVAGALTGNRSIALVGLMTYAAGLWWWGRALARPSRQAPPRSFATWSVTAGLAWGAVALILVGWRIGTAEAWASVAQGYGVVAAVIALGFALQLLFGALSHLIPVVLGGGPSVVRAASSRLDRGWVWRVVVVQLGLVIALLPVPSTVRIAVSVLVLGALGAFVLLLLGAVRAAVAARRSPADGPVHGPGRAGADAGHPVSPLHGRGGQVTGALSTVALVMALGIAVGPALAGGTGATAVSLAGGAAPSGHTTRARVEAHDMAFVPARIVVPAGDVLVVDLVNTDVGSPHDLTFGNGTHTPRVMPGRSATVTVGVVGAPTEGWCSIVGHRQMGMVLHLVVSGAPPQHPTGAPPSDSTSGSTATGPGHATSTPALRLDGAFAAGFQAVDATLPPLTPERVHRVTLRVEEVQLEVAPGWWQKRWTFGGSVPGPTLHGRVGDTFVVTLVNGGSIGHSVDFHAGERAPDAVMRTIPPGGTLTYRFTAARAGIWMYHCSTMPMSAHIAAGLFGTVVIEPPDLPVVNRSYVLVQSEVFVDGDGEAPGREVDADAAAADQPDAVTFNGVANQYTAQPLRSRSGERVRVWVLAAGPNRGSGFHVVGSQFDTVYADGAYLLDRGRGPSGGRDGGAQVLALAPGQGGFVELRPTEPGRYPFVTHAMADAELGARGVLAVTR
ncbi:multicopper oxidase domain-containing protein [Terrabacter aeriphilus]|uniref:Copper-containing nitrite reductase n=1 Tax=Terrabacter aeriphilus TaxID=515662 RepID=A0ABP9JI55_9MICO